MLSKTQIFGAAPAVLLAASLSGGDGGDVAGNWPQWRGPGGTGMAEGDAPTRWSDAENVRWRVAIPGRGCSTPVVWGERIFLTTAVPTETGSGSEPPSDPPERDRRSPFHGGGGRTIAEHAFEVLCLDRGSGKTLWRKTAIVATPHEGFHRTYGSFASSSPVTDGKRVFAFFGSRGLYCYDLEGELVWGKDFDVEMRMRMAFGEGTAPVLHGKTLLLNFDHEGSSFLVALDGETGEELWRADRDEPSSWAPPLVVEHGGKTQVVVGGTHEVRCYDLETGEMIWECAGLGTNVIPTPVRFGDTVLVMSGHRRPRLMAIELGHEGDLTDTEAVVWSTSKGLSYTPSPLLHGDEYYALMDRGFMSCFDAASGKAHYLQERLPRGNNFKASPVGADGKLYLASESGDVLVVKMGPELELIATNTLEDQFFVASPVIVGGEILLRSLTQLICIGETESD